MKPSWSKASPSRSASLGNTHGIVECISRPFHSITGRRSGSHLTSVSNRSSTSALNSRLGMGRKCGRGAQQREHVEHHHGAVERYAKAMELLEFGLVRSVGLFGNGTNRVDLRTHDGARVESERECDQKRDSGERPPYPRRMRHREVECEDEADDPGNVSQNVVARENAGDHFAGLANRKLAEDDRRGEDREEKHPAEPADDAEQIDEERYHHVGSGTGLVIPAFNCGRSIEILFARAGKRFAIGEAALDRMPCEHAGLAELPAEEDHIAVVDFRRKIDQPLVDVLEEAS